QQVAAEREAEAPDARAIDVVGAAEAEARVRVRTEGVERDQVPHAGLEHDGLRVPAVRPRGAVAARGGGTPRRPGRRVPVEPELARAGALRPDARAAVVGEVEV